MPEPTATCDGCGSCCDVSCPEVEFCLGRQAWSCCADCRDGWHDWCGHTYANGDRCFCWAFNLGPQDNDDEPEQVGPEQGDPQPMVVVVEEAEADEDPR